MIVDSNLPVQKSITGVKQWIFGKAGLVSGSGRGMVCATYYCELAGRSLSE